MTRAFFLVSILILISAETFGQCVNGPTVTLGSTSGSTCGTTPVTVTGNTFGGSATKVSISENGSGSVSPGSVTTSPFIFTYTPKNGDAGKVVIITFTTNNPSGTPCTAAKATYTLSVNSNVTAPKAGTITEPTCIIPTGSVVLSGLPSAGTWAITRTPGQVISSGSGTSVTISGIQAGTYTFTVTNSVGCISPASSNVIISSQTQPPASPAQTIDCTLGPGQAVVTVISPLGTGFEYRLDALPYQTSTSIVNVADGYHTISVMNPSGCTTTGVSFPVACACLNPPTVTLSGSNGTTCGTTPVTVTGNTFGGDATGVTITTDGTGTVNPASTTTQPFAFTYTPSNGDVANTVTITVSTDRTLNSQCVSATSTYSLIVNPNPVTPMVGTITQPTCAVLSGAVELNGLPATGIWTLIRSPGDVTTAGSGISTNISNLSAGTYTFTVIDSAGCISPPSTGIIITAQPAIPAAPLVGSITAPTCSLSTGSVVMNGLPATDNWTLTRYPETVTSTGTGASITLSDLPGGLYNFTLTDANGCVSGLSATVTIPDQPVTPSPPMIGAITQPGSGLSTGSVTLDGLPDSGSWTLTLSPGDIATTGNGATKTISNLVPGTYTFKVTNSVGCTSGSSASFEIYTSTGTPELIINNPPPVCFPSTADITNSKITEGSTINLVYTYWTNAAATIPFNTPSSAPAGIYYIKGTTTDGFYMVKPVTVFVYRIPVANAGSDQALSSKAVITMNAKLENSYESGIWSVISGDCEFLDATNAKTSVSGLSAGKNILLWTVTNGVCPSSYDTVLVSVNDMIVQTLITPNMDGRNDYLILKESDLVGRMELIIFDRRGAQVYKNTNYDNSWNGIDYKGKPIPDDTYFYVIKSESGISMSGYIVIRR